jgi:hypothetical protein
VEGLRTPNLRHKVRLLTDLPVSLEKGSLLVWQFRIAYGLAAGLFEVRMSPILLMILVYFLSALVFVGVLVFFMKIDPKHEEVAKDAYKKRLQEELKRLG